MTEVESDDLSIEKHIKKLEKENKELKTVKIPQLERKIASIRGAHSVDCKKLNAKIDQCERQKELIKNLNKDIQNKDLALEDYTKWSESQKKNMMSNSPKQKKLLENIINTILVVNIFTKT